MSEYMLDYVIWVFVRNEKKIDHIETCAGMRDSLARKTTSTIMKLRAVRKKK